MFLTVYFKGKTVMGSLDMPDDLLREEYQRRADGFAVGQGETYIEALNDARLKYYTKHFPEDLQEVTENAGG